MKYHAASDYTLPNMEIRRLSGFEACLGSLTLPKQNSGSDSNLTEIHFIFRAKKDIKKNSKTAYL